MNTLNISTLKATPGTLKALNAFVYENRHTLGQEQKMLYTNIRSLLERELTKPAGNRMAMNQITEKAYNIEQYILASGAAAVTTEYININQ